jgi:hypothetical protein
MEDRDIGEMFLNFILHWRAQKFAAVDSGLLGYAQDKSNHWGMCWKKNLIDFKQLLYNSVQMYRVTEEIIQGDW